MTKRKGILILLAVTVFISFTACGKSSKLEDSKQEGIKSSQETTVVTAPTSSTDASSAQSASSSEVTPGIDLEKVKPNEAGKIMVVMFHNFIAEYKSGDKAYTTTFADFKNLLGTLYEKGYRLISMNDFLNNNITVPAGCIPMVFTFDDGTAGQFNLVDDNGKLTVNKNSAVGVMEEFNKLHPDFGLRGTFYVNLGNNTFPGKGTLTERLKYLTDAGFEIGNHTYTHIKLTEVKTAEKVQEEIGQNQKKMYELIPDYKMDSLSLPYGLPSKELQGYVAKGEFEGIKYENRAIMEVGWDPTYPASDAKFNPLSVHRVRAAGIKPVEADLSWWLEKLSRAEQYVSDGNPDTISVPKAKEALVDNARLGTRKLVIY